MQIGWNKMVFRKQNEPVQLTAQNTIQMWLTFLKKKKFYYTYVERNTSSNVEEHGLYTSPTH